MAVRKAMVTLTYQDGSSETYTDISVNDIETEAKGAALGSASYKMVVLPRGKVVRDDSANHDK